MAKWLLFGKAKLPRKEHIITYFDYKLKNKEIQDLNGSGNGFWAGLFSWYMEGYSIHYCWKISLNYDS